MKKQLLICLLALSFPATQLFSQDSVTHQLPTVTVTSSATVTKDVDKAFKATFPNAENLRWYKLDKDYLAKFIVSDMSHNALFKKNGYLKYDVSYGNENNLPADILKQVQSAYEDFKITRVFNVKESGRDIWVVNLESLKNYVLVRVEEGELEEVSKIQKAK